MDILVSGIRLSIDEPEEEAIFKALKRAGVSKETPASVYKRSIDARRGRVSFVYSIRLTVEGEGAGAFEGKLSEGIKIIEESQELKIDTGKEKLSSRPVICGFGPSGLFAGLILSRLGYAPIIIERGLDIDSRSERVSAFMNEGRFDPATNIQFGEGGAGTFSDGKLTTRINDPLCSFVLSELVRFGAPASILKEAKPHVGTDKLKTVVKNMRQEITSHGGEVFFGEKLEDIELSGGALSKIKTDKKSIDCAVLILATGHSARDTYEMLLSRSISIEPKAFSVGVRIEHLQEEINRAQYGEFSKHPKLMPVEYQLSHREGERGVYTFCMCPGGIVVPSSSEEGGVVTNGMSVFLRDGVNSNSALVVSVAPKDFGGGPLGGILFQRELERKAFKMGGGNYFAPAQTVGSFLSGRANRELEISHSYMPGVKFCDLTRIFPKGINEMLKTGLRLFGKQLSGFSNDNAVLTGVESRTSSPVRIIRGSSFEAVGLFGIYPCGEGAGYAGGIMSAAVDGVKTAKTIAEKYAPIG